MPPTNSSEGVSSAAPLLTSCTCLSVKGARSAWHCEHRVSGERNSSRPRAIVASVTREGRTGVDMAKM